MADKVLEEATQAETREEQKQIDQKNKKVVKDVLDTHPSPAKNVIEEVWNLASLDSELEHSVNVATYSVIFAMAFGKLDPDLVTDLALAGLMHDIGLPQVPYSVTSKPLQQLTDADRKHYAVHLDEAIRLINEHAPEITDRSKQILLQHHEQFNGQGYPKKLEGFNFDDVAQIVAMADMVDAMSTGQWDGKERPMRDAILQLEKLEKATSFPVYFNPEVFSSVMRWMKSDRAKTAMKDANQVVDSQVQSVILQDDEKKAS